MTRRLTEVLINELENAFSRTIEERPIDTVALFVDLVGESNALETITSLVQRYEWDGRISKGVKEWAVGFDSHMKDPYTKIHVTHLNQIAEAMMSFYEEKRG